MLHTHTHTHTHTNTERERERERVREREGGMETDRQDRGHAHTNLRSSSQIQKLINNQYSFLDLSYSIPYVSHPNPK